MAVELARFQNFAKLKDTEIAFNDITVLAGKPSTGKSYVMKFMYGVNEAPFVDAHKSNSFASKINNDLDSVDIDKDKELTQAYSNSLQSIFGNLNQINANFTIAYQNIQLAYENNTLVFNRRNSNDYSLSNDCIFVETPLILEFYQFLDNDIDGKVPYHISHLVQILRKPAIYSATTKEQNKFIEEFTQSSNSIIDGYIENKGNSFSFVTNNNKEFNIINASSGIKSIGLLQYLVSSKAIKEGSILFWEEPEVHLHPEWQLKMVDLFVELMNAGVKIVFSTHSPYMADYLNAISKRQEFRDRISFNVLDEKDGVVTNHILDDKNWNILQKELMDTFEDILWQYL